MKKIFSKRSVQITLSLLVFTTAFILLHYSPLGAVHGRSDAALIVAIFGVFSLLIAYIFSFKYLMVTATLGYIPALLLGVIFNTDGVDGGGGVTNNLWQIWLVSYWVFIGVGLILDIIKKLHRRKETNFTKEITKTQTQEEHKFLSYGVAFGLPIGTAFAVVFSIMTGANISVCIGICAGFCMLIGVVVGATLDHQIKK